MRLHGPHWPWLAQPAPPCGDRATGLIHGTVKTLVQSNVTRIPSRRSAPVVQGWAKHARGDEEGGLDCLDRAILMTPPGTVDLILEMIRSGELPTPGPDTMDQWAEIFQEAKSGELSVTHADFDIPLVREDQGHAKAPAADTPSAPRSASSTDGKQVAVVCMGLADGSSAGDITGAWLVNYDPAGNDGNGDACWSHNPADAARFTVEEWAELYDAVPANRPRRPDGKPNRPITMLNLMVVPVDPGEQPSFFPDLGDVEPPDPHTWLEESVYRSPAPPSPPPASPEPAAEPVNLA